MLVLSRKQGDKLFVGDDVTITVTKCTRNRVVIGIEAPREVSVKRAELIAKDFDLNDHGQALELTLRESA